MNKDFRRFGLCVFASIAGVWIAGCSVDQQTAKPVGSLRHGAVPTDFTFSNTKTVGVTLSADKALFNAKGTAGVEVSTSDGKLLYQGAIRADQPLKAKVTVPNKETALKVTFRTQGVEKNSSIAIANGAAAYSFQ